MDVWRRVFAGITKHVLEIVIINNRNSIKYNYAHRIKQYVLPPLFCSQSLVINTIPSCRRVTLMFSWNAYEYVYAFFVWHSQVFANFKINFRDFERRERQSEIELAAERSFASSAKTRISSFFGQFVALLTKNNRRDTTSLEYTSQREHHEQSRSRLEFSTQFFLPDK